MSIKSEADFQKDQVVWAKLTGYPWWPGVIQSVDYSQGAVFTVKFLGEESQSHLPQNKIKPFEKNKYLESKSTLAKFKNGVAMAYKKIGGQSNHEDEENCKNSKSGSKFFYDHIENIQKSVREEQEYSGLNSDSMEKTDQRHDISVSEIEGKKEDEQENNDIKERKGNFLNKKRERLTNQSSSEIMKKDVENHKEVEDKIGSSKKILKNTKSPAKNHPPKKGKNKLNSIDFINIKKEEKSQLTENSQPANPGFDQANVENSCEQVVSNMSLEIFNINNPQPSSELMNIDSASLHDKDPTKILEENSRENLKSQLVSLKLNTESFSMNAAEIISTIKFIDEATDKSSESGTNCSEDILETFNALKDNYLILYENSIKIRKIVKDSIENSKRSYSSHKIKENVSLIEDIQKLQDMMKEQLSESENATENESKEILKVDASLRKYLNLWNFMNKTLSEEFNSIFETKAFSSIENFHNFVINGNYLKEEIQKLRKVQFRKEGEKTRDKVITQVNDIFSKSCTSMQLSKNFLKNLSVFLELKAVQKDKNIRKVYEETINSILKKIKEYLVLNTDYLYDLSY